MMLDPADLNRIEEKLDSIIAFFNIGKAPSKSPKQIDDWAKHVAAGAQRKRRRSKK